MVAAVSTTKAHRQQGHFSEEFLLPRGADTKWTMLAFAIVLEVTGPLSMRASEGFSRLGFPTSDQDTWYT